MEKIKKCKLRYLALMLFLLPTVAWGQTAIKRTMKLDELFALADSCSRRIKVSEAVAKAAKTSIDVSKNAFLPDVKVDAMATYMGDAWVSDRDFTNGQTFSSPHFGNSFSLEVSQVLFAGGAIANKIKATQIEWKIAELGVRGERQCVRFLLTGYYLDLYKSYNILTIYEKNIEQTRQVIDVMKAKVSSGIALDNDITRYELQLQNLLYRKTELEGRILIYNSQLVMTLGLPKETEIIPDSSMLDWKSKSYTENELQDMAILHYPSLEQSQLKIALEQKRLKIVQAGLMPKLSFVAADNLKGPITYEIPTLNNNINIWYMGVRLSYDIGNLYKTPKEKARENQALCQAEEQYAANQEQVSMGVKEAYIDYKNAFELLRTQKKSLQLATENRDMISKQYMSGLALIIDILDADDLKLSAEIQEANAQINIIYNYYKLLYVTGTL